MVMDKGRDDLDEEENLLGGPAEDEVWIKKEVAPVDQGDDGTRCPPR